MGLLNLCEKYFETTNLYEVLGISENASDKEVIKAYHKLSLKVHPDRVQESEKLEATEKFKVLGSIHAILTDKDKRAQYDETKSVDDDDYNVISDRDWSVYWRLLFKKITDEDIIAYKKEYVGSALERKELKHAYITGKGDMDYIVDHVQFARTEHEPRIREILTEMIENGEIPPFKVFTNEPAKKRQRRHAKENREAKEAEEMKKEMGLGSARKREVSELHRRNTALRVDGAHITRAASRDSDRARALLAERQHLAKEENSLRMSLERLKNAIEVIRNY